MDYFAPPDTTRRDSGGSLTRYLFRDRLAITILAFSLERRQAGRSNRSHSMNLSPLKSLLVPSLLAAALLPAAADPAGAECLLRQMSETLASAHTFSFSAMRTIDGALVGVEDVPLKARVNALVERPDKFTATSMSRGGERRFFADGRMLTIFEAKTNFYASVPMPATLDLLVDELDQKYGFVPPLAEFALSNPYREFRNEADTSATSDARKSEPDSSASAASSATTSRSRAGRDAELWIGVADHLRASSSRRSRICPPNPGSTSISGAGISPQKRRRRLHLHSAQGRHENRNVDCRENGNGPKR